MFDISDSSSLKEMNSLVLKDYNYSEALYNLSLIHISTTLGYFSPKQHDGGGYVIQSSYTFMDSENLSLIHI